MREVLGVCLLWLLQPTLVTGFTILPQCQNKAVVAVDGRRCPSNLSQPSSTIRTVSSSSSTQLYALLDVPEYFFTISFPVLGIFLSISKNIARSRLEERAWEQRLEEARERKLASDPTLTEMDLRRRESKAEWSAYGNQPSQAAAEERSFSSSSKRVAVKERVDQDPSDLRRQYTMTDEQIDQFEREFGLEYDPYYDDPYTEEELPEDVKYRTDKVYGDRIYEDGEVFYKDANTGLYFRQGSQPRIQKMWSF